MTFSPNLKPSRAIFLVDNGSLRPTATLALRRIAAKLSQKAGEDIQPVSVLHSDKVPAEELGGQPAEVFVSAVTRLLNEGVRYFTVLPLFFGPSRALTDYLPEAFSRLTQDITGAELAIAEPLGGSAKEPDERLAQALAEQIRNLNDVTGELAPVVVVDHGSPLVALAELRNRVGQQLSELPDLGGRRVMVASMERRPDPEYDFNEPLLESVLGSPGYERRPVVVAQLFLLEGRHAGPSGDIAEICARAESENPGLNCHRTELLGEQPLISEILQDRLHEVLNTI